MMDNMQKNMTKEEFRTNIKEMIADMANPHGDFALILRDGSDIEAEIRNFDPMMADKFAVIITSIRDFGDYVAQKGELFDPQTKG